MQIRNKRDFWSGVMFVAIGVLFIILSRQYQLGTAAKMGPGYFPSVLGGICTFLGLILGVSSLGKRAQKTELLGVGWRELILVLLAVILFAALLNYMGIVVAITVLILVSAVASYEFNLRATLISVVILLVMSYVVFVWGLELQFPVWPKFMRS